METEGWAHKLIIEYFNRKVDITLKKIANDNNLSLIDFYRDWQLTISPKKFLTFLRLMKAFKMLSYNHGKIRDIADELKFCDHYYFCKWFKKLTGVTPKKFQLRYGSYFRRRLYQKIKLKNFDIKSNLWVLKILEDG